VDFVATARQLDSMSLDFQLSCQSAMQGQFHVPRASDELSPATMDTVPSLE
jgi:hypothetical protein